MIFVKLAEVTTVMRNLNRIIDIKFAVETGDRSKFRHGGHHAITMASGSPAAAKFAGTSS